MKYYKDTPLRTNAASNVGWFIAVAALFVLIATVYTLTASAEEITYMRGRNAALESEIAELKATVHNYEIAEKTETSMRIADGMPAYFDANTLGWDFDYVVRVVGAEARGEPLLGMMAVAQCIKDTAERTGLTPEYVVKADGQYAAPVDSLDLDGMEDVNEACLLVFAAGERAVDADIEYFKAVGTPSAWHDGLEKVCTIGNHEFYKVAYGD